MLLAVEARGWEEGAYPILLAAEDRFEPVGVVDRFGTIQCARGVYVYPPSFADGADSGWAIRRRDGVVVHVDKVGNERFELPEAWFDDVHPWAVYANISEGEFVCFVDALELPKEEERRYVCVNSRGVPSRVYEGNGTAFYHGRALVRRDGWVYLLDHDYREVPVCRDVEGITVGILEWALCGACASPSTREGLGEGKKKRGVGSAAIAVLTEEAQPRRGWSESGGGGIHHPRH